MPSWSILQAGERQRRSLLVTVFCLLLAASFIPFFLTKQLGASEARKILDERSARAQVQLSEYFDEVRGHTRNVGNAVKERPTQASFDEAVKPLIESEQYLSIGVIDQSERPAKIMFAGGLMQGQGSVVDDHLQEVIDGFSAFKIGHVEVIRTNNIPTLAVFQSAIGPADSVIYSEIPLSRFGEDGGAALFGVDTLIRHELYAGTTADEAQLIATNGQPAQRNARQIEREVRSGTSNYLLVSRQSSPLLSTADRALPWLLLFGGFAMAFIVSWLLRYLLKRNEEVERAAHERDAEAFAILDAAHEAFVSFREDGTVLRWSNSASALFGWDPSEVSGKKANELFVPVEFADEKGGVGVLFEMASAPGSLDARIEVDAKHKNGSLLPIEITLWRGTFKGEPSIKTLSRDIREHRRLMEELSRSRSEALDASRLKSEFLANMSHEIRTPMNGVLGMVDLLARTQLDSRQREYVETIQTSATALLTLLNDILDFSKIEAGKLEVDQATFDLRHAINSSIELMLESARTKGLQISHSTADDVPVVVVGDKYRLRQVLINLLGNAIKFTDEGHVDVRVSKVSEDSDSTIVRIDVEDTGIGISRANQSRLFESFEQVDMSVVKRHEGTGLGLAIAKRLASLMGGEIGFHSDDGRGSTFWFTVRLGKQSKAGLEAQSTPIEPTRSSSGESARETDIELKVPQGTRVLLAEDNVVNQRIASIVLTNAGCEVDVVATGAQAIEAVRNNDYAAVFMDYQMPEVAGHEATRRIRELESEGEHLPIIALTASAMKGDREKAIESGMDDYLTKPVSARELVDCLNKWVGGTETVSEVPSDDQKTVAVAVVNEMGIAGSLIDVDRIESLKQSLGGSINELRDLLDKFESSARSDVEALFRALDGRDYAAMALIAHRLRGGSSTLGIRALVDCTKSIEQALVGESGKLSPSRVAFVRSLVEELAERVEHSLAEVKAWLDVQNNGSAESVIS